MSKGRRYAPEVLKTVLRSPDTLYQWDVTHREKLSTFILAESVEKLRFIEDILKYTSDRNAQ